LHQFAAYVDQQAREYWKLLAHAAPSLQLPAALRMKVVLHKKSTLKVLPCTLEYAPQYLTVLNAFPKNKPTQMMPPVRVMLDHCASDTNTMAVFYKTSDRAIYNAAQARMRAVNERLPASVTQFDDVLLWNKRGEVTESSIANIAIHVGGVKWITPPMSCGLLPGVMRQHLLNVTGAEHGSLETSFITVQTLKRMVLEEGRDLVGFNALRGIYLMTLVHVDDACSLVTHCETPACS